MRPPRKPPSSPGRTPRPKKAEQGRATSRPSPSEQARRVAESWGVAPENKPARKSGSGRPAAAGTKAAASRRDGKAPAAAPARSKNRTARPEAPARAQARTRPGGQPGPATPRPVRAPRSPDPAPVHRIKAASEPQRIAKLLARAGVASRREIERMIAEGRIALDGVPVETPATLLTSLRGVSVDGQPVADAEAARLFLFHKPSGCLTTERDPAGRPTIYDRLPAGLPRLMPVGRLDMTTEGLLLLTNDGGLKRRLELPSSGVERTYRARAFGDISQAQLEELIEGIEVDGIRYGRIDANLERRTGRNQWIEMTLTEGKNREVRRVLEHLGLTVNRLIRVRYGPFDLADSAPGDLVEIKRGDLDRFLHQLKERG
ncbi:23S rRNA pseudouridine2605 synthase [Sphingobium jiangsuense]|uniref:Pseudouridine synthase n=3 Tax=Sphingobium jiangsuense TaxID=870476 RepID=A0A7W6BG49_9SPHN|nr:pseudouridine synthase [Sphingobium jiangsuense]MBB3925414.1 23S rRNA pseudouridine2605 synthase [Sphingobium jiangsuense]